MQFNPVTLAATIVGGLLVAAILGWIRRPRLVVLVPRSFSYSQITDRGQLVEISVFNRGFKTEEAIDITLNNSLRYELVGSNSQEASVNGNKITIPRVGPADDVTVLLLVEPGTFKQDDIVQCLSKETKGAIVAKLENVPPSGPQRIAIVGMFVVVPALLYGMSFALDYVFDLLKDRPAAVAMVKEKRTATQVQGWNVPLFHKTTSLLFEPFVAGKITAAIGAVSRKGEIATVPVSFTNQTDEVLTISFSAKTAFSPKRFKSYELMTNDFVVVPGKTETRTLRVVVPESGATLAERTAFVDVNIQNMTAQTLTFRGSVEIK